MLHHNNANNKFNKVQEPPLPPRQQPGIFSPGSPPFSPPAGIATAVFHQREDAISHSSPGDFNSEVSSDCSQLSCPADYQVYYHSKEYAPSPSSHVGKEAMVVAELPDYRHAHAPRGSLELPSNTAGSVGGRSSNNNNHNSSVSHKIKHFLHGVRHRAKSDAAESPNQLLMGNNDVFFGGAPHHHHQQQHHYSHHHPYRMEMSSGTSHFVTPRTSVDESVYSSSVSGTSSHSYRPSLSVEETQPFLELLKSNDAVVMENPWGASAARVEHNAFTGTTVRDANSKTVITQQPVQCERSMMQQCDVIDAGGAVGVNVSLGPFKLRPTEGDFPWSNASTPSDSGMHSTASGGTGPAPGSSKVNKFAGKGGKLLQRFRSLSTGPGAIAPTGEDMNDVIMTGILPDPGKLPKVPANSSTLVFSRSLSARSSCAAARVRKLSIPSVSTSPMNKNLPSGRPSSSCLDEELVARLSSIHCRDELEKALHPTYEKGLAGHALQVGVTRASENKRFLMLSKSPLRTAEEFLLEGVRELEEEFAFRTFFQLSTCYDLMPASAKLIVIDRALPIGRAFKALVDHSIRAAPVWNSVCQEYTGMLTITDFIRIMDIYYHSTQLPLEEVEAQTVGKWLDVIAQHKDKLLCIQPGDSLLHAVHLLNHNRIHRLPVVDERSGDLLHIITHKRLLKYLWLRHRDMPADKRLQLTLDGCGILQHRHLANDIQRQHSGGEVASNHSVSRAIPISGQHRRPSACLSFSLESTLSQATWAKTAASVGGSFDSNTHDTVTSTPPESSKSAEAGVHTVRLHTYVMDAMRLFLQHRVSALPVVDENNRLLDIMSKFDCINLATRDSRKDLDVTVQDVLSRRLPHDYNGVITCLAKDTLKSIVDKFVHHDVHRLVVVNNMEDYQVTGILSLSDFIGYLFDKPTKAQRPVKRARPISDHLSSPLSLDRSNLSLDLTSDFNLFAASGGDFSSPKDSPLLSTLAPSPRGASAFRARYRQRSNTTESLPEEEEVDLDPPPQLMTNHHHHMHASPITVASQGPLHETVEDEVFKAEVM